MTTRHYFVPPSDGQLPYVSLQLSAPQLIGNNIVTAVLWDTVLSINNAYFSYDPATGVITILKSGIYTSTASIIWTTNTGGGRWLSNAFNDGAGKPSVGISAPGFQDITSVANVSRMTGSGFCRSFCFQNCGAGLNIVGGSQCFYNVVRLGDL